MFEVEMRAKPGKEKKLYQVRAAQNTLIIPIKDVENLKAGK